VAAGYINDFSVQHFDGGRAIANRLAYAQTKEHGLTTALFSLCEAEIRLRSFIRPHASGILIFHTGGVL